VLHVCAICLVATVQLSVLHIRKAIVRPTLEYAATEWNPHNSGDTQLLEALQNQSAQWICGSRWSPITNY